MMMSSNIWNNSQPTWFHKKASSTFSILPKSYRKGFVFIRSMMKQSLERDKKWKLWLEFQLWSSPIIMHALNPTSSTFFLIQALLKIFSDDFVTSSAFSYCWFSCFHSLCYLGKIISWDPRKLSHIYAIINKKSPWEKYARMRLVPLSSFAIIKIPVSPATLDAWEELLIYNSNHL